MLDEVLKINSSISKKEVQIKKANSLKQLLEINKLKLNSIFISLAFFGFLVVTYFIGLLVMKEAVEIGYTEGFHGNYSFYSMVEYFQYQGKYSHRQMGILDYYINLWSTSTALLASCAISLKWCFKYYFRKKEFNLSIKPKYPELFCVISSFGCFVSFIVGIIISVVQPHFTLTIIAPVIAVLLLISGFLNFISYLKKNKIKNEIKVINVQKLIADIDKHKEKKKEILNIIIKDEKYMEEVAIRNLEMNNSKEVRYLIDDILSDFNTHQYKLKEYKELKEKIENSEFETRNEIVIENE
ncbi:MAG: hypothetical protein CL760_01440 [Chloroflexi bacterium]|nr:hypothetical protein [Chloroflexota bacterium]|tara:strand:+ start:82065 stop:82958 length:894 start_codon:yes stop_codon:yes gene_type:complete